MDKLIIENYGAENLDRVKTNMKNGTEESKRRFVRKYPYANLDKFEFMVELKKNGDIDKYVTYYKIDDDVSYDITSRRFLKDKEWTKHLYWQEPWGISGTVQPFVKNPTGTQHKINSFKIYVTADLYFDAGFTNFNIENNEESNDYKDNTYLAALFAAYITTYTCGICTEHFEYNNKTPRIVTSIARYHLYYHMRRFIRQPGKMSRFITQEMQSLIIRNKPFEYEWISEFYYGKDSLLGWVVSERTKGIYVRGATSVMSKHGGQVGISYQRRGEEKIRDVDDYKTFIATKSNGLTKTGQLLLQQSIESYVYCVLGAQARTRWPIVGRGAMSLQTQEVFLRLVEDTIIQDDKTVAIRNMRTAIKDTNVVLNMAISPGVMLVTSNMIILTKMVSGYNNVLTLAGSGMRFGENYRVNYSDTDSDNTESELRTKTVEPQTKTVESRKAADVISGNPNTSQSELYLLTITLIGGSLVSRFII